jgi:predicted transcriptional regulator
MSYRRAASSAMSAEILDFVLSRGHTQADVARMLDVSESFVSLVKSAERGLTLDHVESLSERLSMPMGELFIAVTERRPGAKQRKSFGSFVSFMRQADAATATARRAQRDRAAKGAA